MPSIFRELPLDDGDDKLYLEEVASSHAPYGLITNPFPLGGNFPEGYLDYTYIKPFDLRKIQSFLIKTFVRQEFNGLLMLGEYGSGKTHLLSLINQLVNSDPQHRFRGRALSFLIKNPSISPDDILLSLLREVKLTTIQDMIFLPIRRRLRSEYKDDVLKFINDFSAQAKGRSTADYQLQGILEGLEFNVPWAVTLFQQNYREFLELLTANKIILNMEKMRKFSRKALQERLDSDESIVESLVNLVFSKEGDNVNIWEAMLVGGFSGRRGQGVEYYLEAFLKLFREMGVRHVYLLVDEVEDLRTQRISPKAATEYLATLRRMIQHNYKHFSFALASTQDAWKELDALYPSIGDRFPERIVLSREPAQLKDIVLNYLEKARPADGEEYDSWFPFTEESLDKIIQIRGNVLRHVLTACRKVLDHMVDNSLPAPINPDLIDEDLIADPL
jgi:energy-coupling factor transporter ATP-binding protein EcfA2